MCIGSLFIATEDFITFATDVESVIMTTFKMVLKSSPVPVLVKS